MHKHTLGLSVAVLLSFASLPVLANPLSFDFSFHDYANGGDIAGIVSGLYDNTAGQAATSVFIASNTAGYGVGEYIGNPVLNYWDVSNGVITLASLYAFGASNTAPDVVCCSLVLEHSGSFSSGGLRNSPSSILSSDRSVVTFTSREAPDLTAPASIALVLLGLVALGLTPRG